MTMGNPPDGGGFTHPDGSTKPIDAAIDARPIDAPPGEQTVTLTQTTTNTLLANNVIACAYNPESGNIGTAANTYYRVFNLGSAGITGPFTTSQVTFQVEDCESANDDGTTLAVRVGTYSGTIGTTITASDITIIDSNNSVAVPEVDEGSNSTPGATVTAPISALIPADSQLVIEVDAPDGENTYQFYMGTNASGETADSYWSAATCSPPGTTPENMGTVAGHEVDFLMTVTGTYTP
jgi:hypothetical protein